MRWRLTAPRAQSPHAAQLQLHAAVFTASYHAALAALTNSPLLHASPLSPQYLFTPAGAAAASPNFVFLGGAAPPAAGASPLLPAAPLAVPAPNAPIVLTGALAVAPPALGGASPSSPPARHLPAPPSARSPPAPAHPPLSAP